MALAAVLLTLLGTRAANPYGLPDQIQQGNILHCFDWTFAQIQEELPNIAKAGFVAVQVSPVQGACALNAEWYYAYLPYDFALKGNGNGSKEELRALCTAAHEYGVKIIVDVVANHVNGSSSYRDPWWNSGDRLRYNGGIDYSSRYSITHNQLGDYGDVNSELGEVQQRALGYVQELKEVGVDGIRWDAAKHIGLPSEGCDFFRVVTEGQGLYNYGELLDSPGGSDANALMKEYAKYMSLTDNGYSKGVLDAVKSGSVPSGYGGWSVGTLASDKVVYWAESHDTYSNDGQETTFVPQDQIDRAWAIVACRSGESSLYLSRPSATSRNSIRMGQKGSTHALETPYIAEVNKFRNAATGTQDYYTGASGVATITRKGFGAVVVVGNGQSGSVSAANGGGYCPEGTYTDRVSGNTFTVTSSTISGTVGQGGIAVLYNDVEKHPAVALSPDGGAFYNDGVTVTATLSNATSGWYRIGDGDEIPISGTAGFTIGQGLAIGQSVTVAWSATDGTETCTGSATYTRAEMAENTIYFDNSYSNWDNVYVHYWGGASQSTWPGAKMTCVGDNLYSFSCPGGTTGLVFNIGSNNSQTGNLAFEAGHVYNNEKDLGAWAPDALYVVGTLGNGSWDTANALPMTRLGTQYYIMNVELAAAAADNPSSYFTFLTRAGSNWDAVNAYDRYGAPANDSPIALDNSVGMKKFARNYNASSAYSWKANPGTYHIIADFATNKVTLTHTVGVEGVDADDPSAPAVYYTLQGVRVENPAPGLYIEVRGGRSRKTVIR